MHRVRAQTRLIPDTLPRVDVTDWGSFSTFVSELLAESESGPGYQRGDFFAPLRVDTWSGMKAITRHERRIGCKA